jgi:hypothetical protein
MIDFNTIGSESVKSEKRIVPVFLSNGKSSTIIIPIGIARKYAIDKPSHVTIEDTENGILIKKLEVN